MINLIIGHKRKQSFSFISPSGKTIYNKYNKWSKDGIFEIAYNYFIKENYFKLSKLKNNKFIIF